MLHTGSCHCGKVRFQVEGEVESATSCNCSICQRKGVLMWFVPHDRLRLASAPEALSTYTFNKHVISHRFCAVCGIHTYGEGVDPKGNRIAAINIRCLEDIDPASVPVQFFDGRSL
jgi:hypothetical protein